VNGSSERIGTPRSVVGDAPYGIFKANLTGKLLMVNPALEKMLGYKSQDELLAVNLASGIYRHPAEYQKINDLFLRDQHFKDVEVEWKRKDGTFITVRCSGWTVRDDSNAYIEIFAEDVTERRVLERQLRMAQKMEAVGRLSGGIAHDFNNLLGVIIGYIQVMKRNLVPGQSSYEYAEEIEKAGQRAVSLTRQLLAFSRQQVLEPVILNLNTLVSDMEKMLPRLIGEDIQLDLILDPGIGQVKADPGQIEQVVMNLAVNARDAMPDGGKLTIQTANAEFDAAFAREHPGSIPGQYVMLAVTDTGTGMDPEIQAQIFEPFFTTKGRDKGTGLGLATVYGVVKQSSGKPFEELSATENVSQSGFLCGCTALLKKDSTIEVYLVSGGTKFVGKARVVRSERCDTSYPRYAFRFVEKEGDWILQ
jgi:two-component system, cell cycle sensor histidine kinase and response regulator CckA